MFDLSDTREWYGDNPPGFMGEVGAIVGIKRYIFSRLMPDPAQRKADGWRGILNVCNVLPSMGSAGINPFYLNPLSVRLSSHSRYVHTVGRGLLFSLGRSSR